MLAILVLGRTYGVIAAFITASCTFLLWNHPWAIIIFTGEAVVVSWLYEKRKGNLVVYDLIYWICVGMPSVYLFYHMVMGVAVQATLVVMLKQSINGLTNALLATLALLLYKFIKKPLEFKVSYADLLPVAMISFALFPTMFLSTSAIRTYEENDMDELLAQVASITQIVQKNLSGWINDYHGNVQVLAKFIGDPNTRPFKEMQRYVETIREANPALKGMGVFDSRSISVSYSPLERDGKSTLGIDLSSQPHIATLKEGKKPYITDMLIGKLAPPAPIVILLAPIVISGEYKGYCSGVVETSSLASFLRNLKTESIHITLVDGQNKVIVSTSPDFQTNSPFTRPYLQPGQETSGYQPILWQPEAKPNTNLMQRWRHSFLFSSIPVSENCRWRLIVEAPLLPVAEDISRYCLTWLGFQGLLISAAIVLSSLLSRGFIANVQKLQLLTRSVQERLDDASRIEWPNSAVEELSELSSNFRQMTSALTNHITELKCTENALRESEEALKATLHEKEVMLKEIHHRVKNNLQVISSLISMQSDLLTDERIREELDDLRDRIRSMALVHEKLYQTDNLAQIDFADYAVSMLKVLWRSHGAMSSKIQLNLAVVPVMLPIKTAVPCGLILNELALNAIKYAFPHGGSGEVTVSLQFDAAAKTVILRVHDNGVGLPVALDWRHSPSLGLRLVQILTGQLCGTVEKGTGPGADFQITFPLNEQS